MGFVVKWGALFTPSLTVGTLTGMSVIPEHVRVAFQVVEGTPILRPGIEATGLGSWPSLKWRIRRWLRGRQRLEKACNLKGCVSLDPFGPLMAAT